MTPPFSLPVVTTTATAGLLRQQLDCLLPGDAVGGFESNQWKHVEGSVTSKKGSRTIDTTITGTNVVDQWVGVQTPVARGVELFFVAKGFGLDGPNGAIDLILPQ